MTKLQNSKYWRLWSAARAARPDLERHAVHRAALGRDKSHLEFNNADCDAVFGAFAALADPANLYAQVEALAQPRKRLLWAISHAAPESYWRAIARDRFAGQDDLDQLTEAQLLQLRRTLANRRPDFSTRTSTPQHGCALRRALATKPLPNDTTTPVPPGSAVRK